VVYAAGHNIGVDERNSGMMMAVQSTLCTEN
jgi:hypothetical protein